MTEYGYMVNGQLIRCRQDHENAKLIIYSNPEPDSDYYVWEEGTGTIIQEWKMNEEQDEVEE